MKNRSDTNDVSDGRKYRSIFDPAIFALIAEVGLNFFRFLKSLGISGEQNLVVLSSRDSFSCNKNELKNARVIINMKKLNLIKHLDLFLNTLVRILPPDTRFIGYFSGAGNVKRNEITGLLEKNGFKTLIMKEMSGSTYFISQNVSLPQ